MGEGRAPTTKSNQACIQQVSSPNRNTNPDPDHDHDHDHDPDPDLASQLINPPWRPQLLPPQLFLFPPLPRPPPMPEGVGLTRWRATTRACCRWLAMAALDESFE